MKNCGKFHRSRISIVGKNLTTYLFDIIILLLCTAKSPVQAAGSMLHFSTLRYRSPAAIVHALGRQSLC
jgi:hypothetical protein